MDFRGAVELRIAWVQDSHGLLCLSVEFAVADKLPENVIKFSSEGLGGVFGQFRISRN